MKPSSLGVGRSQLDRVRGWFEAEWSARAAPLVEFAAALVDLVPDAPHTRTGSILKASDVERLSSAIESIINDSVAIIGAGFIAAPNVVDGTDRYMLWLQRRDGVIRRLRLNFDTTDLNAYDYVGMDWYVHTRTRNLLSLTGPYLDYSGSDALVFTVAAPVVRGGDFFGVVAIDLMAQAAEDLMTSQLCGLPGDAVVVNRDRAVVATNSVRWMPGERLPMMPAQEPERYESMVGIGTWTDWQLAIARPETDTV